MAVDAVQALRPPVWRAAPVSTNAAGVRALTKWLNYPDDSKPFQSNGGNQHGTAPLERRLINPQIEHLAYDDDTKPQTEADYQHAQQSFRYAASAVSPLSGSKNWRAAITISSPDKADVTALMGVGYHVVEGLDPAAQVLVVRSKTNVNAAFFAEHPFPNLRLILRAGVGLDNVDLNLCASMGIEVRNTPTASVPAVSELAVGMALGLLARKNALAQVGNPFQGATIRISSSIGGHQTVHTSGINLPTPEAALYAALDSLRWIRESDESIRGHQWLKSKFLGNELGGRSVRVISGNGAGAAIWQAFSSFGATLVDDERQADLSVELVTPSRFTNGSGLREKTAGIIGFGGIGPEVAQKFLALGAGKVLAYDPYVQSSHQPKVTLVNDEAGLGSLLKQSDIVSIHVPLTSGTNGMVNAGFLEKMKPGAILVNTSRGQVVDEDAVCAALGKRKIFFGTDVYIEEPKGETIIGSQERFLIYPARTLLTAHQGAQTEEAQTGIARELLAITDNVFASA